ncbi:MAG: hypothetical protein U9Q72_01325, partial [Patescibacteria group bacterium]|nr:hypothetical protein [Patescibacteria group bacterium]
MKQKIIKSLLILLIVAVIPSYIKAEGIVGSESEDEIINSAGMDSGSGNETTTSDTDSDVIPNSNYTPSPGSNVSPQNTTTTSGEHTPHLPDSTPTSGGTHMTAPGTGGSVMTGGGNTTTSGGSTSTGATGPWGDGLAKAGAQGLPDGSISEIVFNLASWLLILLGSFAVIGFVIS